MFAVSPPVVTSAVIAIDYDLREGLIERCFSSLFSSLVFVLSGAKKASRFADWSSRCY